MNRFCRRYCTILVETSSIMNVIKQRPWVINKHVLCHEEELHHTKIEKQRESGDDQEVHQYLSWKKHKNRYYVGLKRLA